MPFNSLILPLLGGFLFVSHFNPTSFFAARQSRERLLFYAATAGVVLLVVGRCAELALETVWPAPLAVIEDFAPFPHSFATGMALLVGAVAWWPLNLLFTTESVTRSVVARHGDALELLLVEASDTDALVMLTMDDDKVYVGYVDRQPPNPNAPDPKLRIIPLMSGYRTQPGREVRFTNYYDETLSRLTGQPSPFASDGRDWTLEDFVKVLPIHRIVSAGFFDVAAYINFQRGDDSSDD